MGAFVAAEAVEPLAYNFEPHVTGPEAKGVVPEPSQKAMRAYQHAVTKVLSEHKDIQNVKLDELSDDEVVKLQESLDALSDKMDELTAELCQNQPTRETLSKLPWRHKQLFSKWLQDEFNPGNLKPATK